MDHGIRCLFGSMVYIQLTCEKYDSSDTPPNTHYSFNFGIFIIKKWSLTMISTSIKTGQRGRRVAKKHLSISIHQHMNKKHYHLNQNKNFISTLPSSTVALTLTHPFFLSIVKRSRFSYFYYLYLILLITSFVLFY